MVLHVAKKMVLQEVEKRVMPVAVRKNVDKECGLAGGGKWEARGKQLVKEESKDVVVEWPSDERDPLGEDEIEDDKELPPIDVLEEASDFSENDT